MAVGAKSWYKIGLTGLRAGAYDRAMTNTTAPTATRFVRTLAKRHGLSTAAVVAIARDIDLAVILRPTGVGTKTEWIIDEPARRLAVFADHLAALSA